MGDVIHYNFRPKPAHDALSDIEHALMRANLAAWVVEAKMAGNLTEAAICQDALDGLNGLINEMKEC